MYICRHKLINLLSSSYSLLLLDPRVPCLLFLLLLVLLTTPEHESTNQFQIYSYVLGRFYVRMYVRRVWPTAVDIIFIVPTERKIGGGEIIESYKGER